MSEDILKTPRSARSARRKSLFPHLENLLDSPRSVASLKLSGGSSARKSLPLGFKQEMPRQSSNKEMFVAADGDGFSPIKKTSFYGKNGGYVPKWLKSPDSSTSDLEHSFESKVSIQTPPKKQKTSPKSAPSSLTVASKSGKTKPSKFGMNKGVSHAIKRPKPQKQIKKVSPEKPVVEPKTPKSSKKTLIQTTPNGSNKIAMNKQQSRSVSYEINEKSRTVFKNGQLVFLRRTPRKTPYDTPNNRQPRDSSNGRTPKQLFTPKNDFYASWNPSPAKSRGKNLPSPVKFITEEKDERDDSQNLSEIIDRLDDSTDAITHNKSQDDYAVYVDNDEIAAENDRIAAQAVQELGGIEDFLTIHDHNETPELLSQSAQITNDHNCSMEILKILQNIKSPTKEEKNETRVSNFHLQLDEDNSNDTPTPPPVKEPSVKNFSIFDKSQRKPLANVENTLKTKSNNSSGKVKAIEDDQMIIDAGQKIFGPKTCAVCNTVYHPGNKEDEDAHKIKHDEALGVMKFNGWKNENVVFHFKDASKKDRRILEIRSSEKSHWKIAKNVLKVVDNQLNFSTRNAIRDEVNSKIYLCIADDRVVGFLLAEHLEKNDQVSRIIPKTGNCEDIPSGKCKIGISRIWVAQDFRKQKIATNLVLTFERYFAYGAILKKGENYAFSHTTPDGTNFASKYVGLPNGQFLTYNPCK